VLATPDLTVAQRPGKLVMLCQKARVIRRSDGAPKAGRRVSVAGARPRRARGHGEALVQPLGGL
jgi:hypothetical protein